MKISTLLTAASMAILLAPTAQAANYLIQLDDLETGTVVGNTYKDGNLIQSVPFCCESLVSPYGLWDGATLSADFVNQFNFYEVGTHVLSDTSELSGNAGDNFFTITFNSDGGATPLVAYANGINMEETGNWQDIVFSGSVSNGDFYSAQMRSAIESPVPEPTTWALMLAGLGGVGAALRSRRRATVAA